MGFGRNTQLRDATCFVQKPSPDDRLGAGVRHRKAQRPSKPRISSSILADDPRLRLRVLLLTPNVSTPPSVYRIAAQGCVSCKAMPTRGVFGGPRVRG